MLVNKLVWYLVKMFVDQFINALNAQLDDIFCHYLCLFFCLLFRCGVAFRSLSCCEMLEVNLSFEFRLTAYKLDEKLKTQGYFI